MEDRFKAYLVEAFKTIAPTKAAMEYRKQTLKDMLARAQELRIKGMTDEELIFDTVLEDYEDFGEKLKEFESREIKVNSAKRNVLLGAVLSVALVAILAITYVIIGVAAHVWHPTWLLIVGGIFAGLIGLFALVGVKAVKNKKHAVLRLLVAAGIVLVSVFVFLVLQLATPLPQVWLTFLAMVALIVGADTAIAFLVNGKMKWVELPIFVEVFAVMLYVMLGIIVHIWHPGWILCLAGVVAGLVELSVFVAMRNAKKAEAEKKKNYDKNVKTDEKYWEEW
ncbi:MAG: hypothetical protein IK048_05290 [Clostridia bacterium]|nr:hypothetical protein [Clostridia bacterium]